MFFFKEGMVFTCITELCLLSAEWWRWNFPCKEGIVFPVLRNGTQNHVLADWAFDGKEYRPRPTMATNAQTRASCRSGCRLPANRHSPASGHESARYGHVNQHGSVIAATSTMGGAISDKATPPVCRLPCFDAAPRFYPLPHGLPGWAGRGPTMRYDIWPLSGLAACQRPDHGPCG